MRALSDRVSVAVELLAGSPNDYDSLLEMVGDARFVLLGEASHGTHEFYRERALVTKRLISQRGFHAVAAEADWPAAYRINRYVRGEGPDLDRIEALAGFKRFPQWMWRNADVLDFVGWLREHNDDQSNPNRKAAFYGLDLYSLHASIEAVLAYLGKIDPEAARRARHHYSCFEQFGKGIETYGYTTSHGLSPSCEEAVVKELVALRRKEMSYLQRDGQVAAEAYFCAEQNALVVRNAEKYYRNMFRREVSSWNLRDRHMMESLLGLDEHLTRKTGTPARIVVWAHNSHLGDARATQMGERGELNLGQLVREHFGKQTVSIGFTTYTGSVTAASNWDEPAERKKVRPAHRDSYEALFHEVNRPRFFLNLRDNKALAAKLRPAKLERAIGVIYRPETEMQSHYFEARLPDQFDAVIHCDHTRAVEPLERSAEWELGEVQETFPSGL
jgi:erythromycin esterase-like protein